MQIPHSPIPKTVLIVEDEPDTAEMLSEMMRLSGYAALQAYGGRSALAMLQSTPPDAIILDVTLPDISGLEVLTAIRRDPRFETLPVVLVSGNSRPSDIQAGIVAGASRYLTKPVDFWQLKETLDSLTKRKTNKPIVPPD